MPASLPIYTLEVSVNGARARAVLNGLKLAEVDGGSGGGFTKPSNTHLVGEENVLCLELLPAELDSGEMSTVSDVKGDGAMKRYQAGEAMTPESGEVLRAFDFEDVIARREQDLAENFDPASGETAPPAVTFPLEHTLTFDNEAPSFRALLLEGPVIEDRKRLLTYAEHLRGLMRERDAEALTREFTPKFDDYREAFPGTPDEDPAAGFPRFLEEEFFPGGPMTAFEMDAVSLRAWCDGRIWELYVDPDRPFFTTHGRNGPANELPVYVARIDGSLKIVR